MFITCRLVEVQRNLGLIKPEDGVFYARKICGLKQIGVTLLSGIITIRLLKKYIELFQGKIMLVDHQDQVI